MQYPNSKSNVIIFITSFSGKIFRKPNLVRLGRVEN